MKKLFAVLISLFVASSAHADCEDHSSTESKQENNNAATKYSHQIKIDGMTCGGCVKNVEKALKALKIEKGVNLKVDINLVTVDYTQNKGLSKDDLDKIIKKAELAIESAHYKVVKDI
ncbi:MAG: cation transporter [Bdellovibrionaceae bacterium]|nr:cation transporter [Pseudobdellovibrionaceae bacterium]